ncbi:DUF3631 domain-containing protein [Nocardiopsis sp. FIRDI 009]|uniref:DUF3631 domain-containing protein n=1 Tax=Nocardiopsis sp. FIRDI 009 TaxID=714197 RepID=UPI000E280D10|nr:DUF3631 domain-containing protein [Nocardiopsis sp. FIRDI 009]
MTEQIEYTLGHLDRGDTLADLLDEAHAAFTRYVVLPTAEAVDALVLWCAATHAQAVADHAPRLVIKAPEKRCGKSRCLDIVEALSSKPIVAVNATPAAIFRSIEADEPPTLIFDEADTIFPTRNTKVAENNEELRGLLNAGHQRGRPARRVIGKGTEQVVAEFATFAMAALAGIGSMPDTIEDRAVIITMRRRAPGERIAKFRYRRDQLPLHALRERLSDVIATHLDTLADAEPDMPVEDRAADTWEPLIALADAAGGTWPDRARQAAKALTSALDADGDTSTGVRLLTDCRTVFDSHGGPGALKTSVILEGLKAIEDAPWADWGRSGLTGRKLGDLLAEYGIKPGNVRFEDGSQAKGYLRLKFSDAWLRYCPPTPEAAPSQPPRGHHPSPTPGRDGRAGRFTPSQETSPPSLTSRNDIGTDEMTLAGESTVTGTCQTPECRARVALDLYPNGYCYDHQPTAA